MNLLAPQLVALYVLGASALAVQLRGRVRLRFGRQLTNYSTFTAPFNLFLYAFSDVPGDPVLSEEYTAQRFPELEALRANWETIRDEARAIWLEGQIATRPDDLLADPAEKNGWRRFYLKTYGDFLPSARERCPKSVALLEQLPNVHLAAFTLVPPGGNLNKHRDPFAVSLRYHLGLMTPNTDRCRIYVDGVPYSWRDGQHVLFDETYIHWVENPTEEARIILLCDVERPMRGRLATAVNRLAIRRLMPAIGTRNRSDEKLGVLHRLASVTSALRRAGRRLKRANRRVYYATKYALVAGAIALLVASAR